MLIRMEMTRRMKSWMIMTIRFRKQILKKKARFFNRKIKKEVNGDRKLFRIMIMKIMMSKYPNQKLFKYKTNRKKNNR